MKLLTRDPVELRAGPVPMRGLMIVLGLALLLRVVWGSLIQVVPESDAHAYDVFARNIVNHGVFGWTKDEAFAFWPPGTSLIYALVYRVFGFSYVGIVIVNVLVSIGMIVCTARVAARFLGVRVALWSAGLLAVWPTLIMLNTLLVSEQLFLFFTIAALDAWTSPRGGALVRGLLAGVLLGVAALVRPTALLLPLVFGGAMVLYTGFRRQNLLTQLQLGVLATVAMACVIAPWTWRNYQLYGHFILISTNGGVNLWMGNIPGSAGYMMDLPESVKGMNDYQTNQFLGALANQYIAADPLGFVWRSVLKLMRLYNNESIGALWNTGGITLAFGGDAVIWLKRFTQVSWALIFSVAALGTVWLARSRESRAVLLSPLVLMLAYYSLVHAVVVTGDRYHLVMATQIAVLGGFFLDAVWRRYTVSAVASRPMPSSQA